MDDRVDTKAYPELSHVQRNVLVERVENDSTDTRVTPCAVDQQKLSEESELGDRNVGGSSSLKTFHTANTNTDMGGLNHRHIVGTITNGEKQGLEVTLDKLDDQSLLQWRDTTK